MVDCSKDQTRIAQLEDCLRASLLGIHLAEKVLQEALDLWDDDDVRFYYIVELENIHQYRSDIVHALGLQGTSWDRESIDPFAQGKSSKHQKEEFRALQERDEQKRVALERIALKGLERDVEDSGYGGLLDIILKIAREALEE